jgi:hypothetical protein
MVLAMTSEAGAHVVVHHFFSNGGLRHVAVARSAAYACLIVGRMLELYMRRRREFVDPLPWDLYFPIGKINHLLGLRLIAPEFGVAQHALVNRWNSGSGSRIRADVAINASQTHFEVRVMRKCDRLLRVRRDASQQHAQRPLQSMRLPVDHRMGLTYHVTHLTIAVSTGFKTFVIHW